MLIKKINKKQAEVKMYGNIGGWFVDGFNFSSILDELEASGIEEVTFRMHTYGGSVFEGDVIGGAFARSKMKISIVIDGIAASMGCMVLPYVPLENISIAENAFGMVHRPSSGQGGDAADHLSTAKLLMDMEGNFVRTLSERTGLSGDEIKAKFLDGKDHWLNADEMIKYKLAGQKIKSIASIASLDKQNVEQMTEESIYGHFAAKLDAGTDIPNNNKIEIQMKKELIEAFQLEGVTAESSDTAVLAALQAKFKATNDRLTDLETKAKDEKSKAIKAALDKAQKEGKITDETRKTYEGIGEQSGVAVLNTVLAGLGAKTPIARMINTGDQTRIATADKNWAWYQENDPEALERMPVEDPDTFNALFRKEYGCDPV